MTVSRSKAAPPALSDGPTRIRIALLLLVALLCYVNALHAPWVFDDHTAIVENPYLRALWPPQWFWGAPDQSPLSSRPLVNLSFALNYAAGGLDAAGRLDPFGYRLINVLLHAVAGCVLYRWLSATFGRLPPGTVRPGMADAWAWWLALVWTAHPLATDAVTYITQRTELLASLCVLLTMYGSSRAGLGSWNRWHTAAVASCAAAMASKEMACATPLLVALYDRAFVVPSWRAAWSARRGFYAALAATWLLLAGLMAINPRGLSAGFDLGLSCWDYLLTQCTVIPQYLGRVFWPVGLSIDYGTRPETSWWRALPGGLLLVGLAIGTLVAWRRWPALGFWGAWFFLLLGPSSSLVPVATELAADRRMYLPLVAVLVVSAWALAAAVRRWGPMLGEPRGQRLRRSFAAAVVVVLAGLTLLRNDDFRSEVSIWTAAAQARPGNFRAHHNLAVALLRTDRPDDALASERRALALKPAYLQAVLSTVTLLDASGQADDAEQTFRHALEAEPEHVGVLFNYAGWLAARDRLAEAETMLRRAVAANPEHAASLNELAAVLVRQNRLNDAVEWAQRAAVAAPEDATVAENVGELLYMLNRPTEAEPHLARAVELDPSNWRAQELLNAVRRPAQVDSK